MTITVEMIKGYEHHLSGRYNMTCARLIDGSELSIDVQYGDAKLIAVNEVDDRELGGEELAAVLAHAREHGVFGQPSAKGRAIEVVECDVNKYGMDA